MDHTGVQAFIILTVLFLQSPLLVITLRKGELLK